MSPHEQAFLWAMRTIAPELEQGLVREHVFAPPRKWRFDFCWPDNRIAVEIDGGQFASLGGRHNTDPDRIKMNEAAVRGYRVLHFSGAMVSQHQTYCLLTLAAALQRSVPILKNMAAGEAGGTEQKVPRRRPRTRLSPLQPHLLDVTSGARRRATGR